MSRDVASTASAPNPSTAQARVIVDELARGGLTDAVVCPGSRSAALAIALHEDPRVRVHVHPDERSAGFVALGLGRATGRAAAVVVTSGSAVANLHPAVIEADHGGVPLLLLTADRPPELRDTGANQTIAQVGLFGAALRWSVDLGVAEDRVDGVRTWRATAARALALSGGLVGRAGPVQLNVPFREPTVPVADDGRTSAPPVTADLSGRGAFAPWVTAVRAPRVASDAVLAELAGRAAATERGLILVGGDADLPPGAADALASATGWPLVAEGHAAARSAGRALRCASWLAAEPRLLAHLRPELVLRVGRTTVLSSGRLAAGAHQLLVDADGRWADPDRDLAELVVADPTALVTALVERLGSDAGSDWGDRWRRADAAAAVALDAALDAHDPLSGLRVARDVAGLAPDLPLIVGSSLPIRGVDLAAAPAPGRRILANRGASGIDGVTSTALGVALAEGGALALVGDLSLLHDANAFLLDPDAPPPDLTVVVVANGGGAIFDRLPPARHAPGFERLFVTPPRATPAGVAALHGLDQVEASDPGALADALRTRGAGPRLVVVGIDREQDARRRDAVREAVIAAFAGALG